MRFTRRQVRCVPLLAAALATLALPARMVGQPPTADKPTNQPAAKAIYDTKADAKKQIAEAVAKARRENQRVLVMFGGNWCGWCQRLHALFGSDQKIAHTLSYEYQLVMVDVGKFDKNLDIAAGYGADLKKAGVPFLTVLDADGKPLAIQETGALEDKDHHDAQKVWGFLTKWQAPPRDAAKVVADALKRASADKKAVFLHLGAPWCPWCRRLDDFLAQKEVAEIIGRDFIDLKIDVDRMTDGKAVAARYRKSDTGGIPWFAVLDAAGQTLATSDGPQGNIGYPAKPEEIQHFLSMLKKGGGGRISSEQFKRIETLLKEAGAKLRPAP